MNTTVRTPLGELRELIGRHCRSMLEPTAVPGLTLFRSDGTSPHAGSLYHPTLCVVVQGRKQLMLGDRILEYDASRYLIVTVDLPMSACVIDATPERPYLALTLDLDFARIADLIAAAAEAPPAKRADPFALSPLASDVLEPLVRLVKLLQRPADIAVMAPLIEREILFRLLQGDQRTLLHAAAKSGTHLAQIGRATHWIRTHYADSMRIEALAVLADMSVTSFHRHFKAVTTMSPLQYRTQIRMQEARRLLLLAGRDVAAVGFDVGYESPSQFSRDYRRAFGVPPLRDATRLRSAAPFVQ